MWIIDPETRAGCMWNGAAWVEAERVTVPDSPIYVDLAYLFARLDASRTRTAHNAD